jgi:nucleotide-binding universal stress UspA family protein
VLGFVAISHTVGVGLSAQADLSEQRARAALDDAAWYARQAGIDASTELRHGARAGEQLLTQSAEHDLLAIGCHGGSRLGGMMLGSTATQIAHQAQVPLLIARRGSGDEDFPREILLASDGSPGSWAAARAATRIARAQGSVLRVLFVPDGHPERYRELFKQITAIERLTGSTPAFDDLPGEPAARIVEAARSGRSSLIVIGKRGVRGIRALGSVSERVVHRAPCSVLVLPPAPALPALD